MHCLARYERKWLECQNGKQKEISSIMDTWTHQTFDKHKSEEKNRIEWK